MSLQRLLEQRVPASVADDEHDGVDEAGPQVVGLRSSGTAAVKNASISRSRTASRIAVWSPTYL